MMETVWVEPPLASKCSRYSGPRLYRGYSPLRETPREYFECLEDSDCHDELFLLPERVLDMDSYIVREDLSAIVPSFRRSPHNSLDSSDSGKSLKLMEDSDGFLLARASDDCKTFWLSETSNMNGVGDLPPSLSQSLSTDIPAMMSQSMVVPSASPMTVAPDIMTTSTSSLSSSRKSSAHLRSRAESAAREREREDRMRRVRDGQEEERKKKLVELKQHAHNAQKFREHQEAERRRHIDELRSKDMDRRQQVEERRKDIEKLELERREAILTKNREREGRLETQRRNSRSNIDFAFGSSAPRLIEPRVDSASGYWGSRRATSSANVHSSTNGAVEGTYDRQSAERDQVDLKSKRTSSAQALDRSSEGEEAGLIPTGGSNSAHRRRTDLVPTLVMRREDSSTPRRSPGISRENSTASRPGSALSAAGPSRPGVRIRPASSGGRRPRPMSIATTGMTASMYEERQRPAHMPRQKPLGTPKPDRMKRARSVTSDAGGIDDDNRSTASSQSVGPSRTQTRKTPSQVKAEAAARKAKACGVQSTRPSLGPSTPKSSLGNRREGERRATQASNTPSPAISQDNMESGGATADVRQSTPDIIKDNSKKSSEPRDIVEEVVKNVKENVENVKKDEEDEKFLEEEEGSPNNEEVKEKKMITSEEEAKARIAEKRREMKEQKEREAELERLRLEEEARKEEERRVREEEEMRQMERLAEEGRRAEEERIQKAIQEKEEEDRRVKEEDERLRKEKEDLEKKTKEEAEKREAELQEKLKKEEEERLARKKRIEEIMARTRGKGAAPTPTKKEEDVPPPSPQQPASLDPLGDPTKPDLLGDISEKVEAENARNLSHSASSSPPTEPEIEKGALDSISLKSESTENSSPLITIENGVPSKKSNGVVDSTAGSFDQILDLGDLPDSNKSDPQMVPIPIRAFEENNSQQNNTADLLS